MTVQSSPKGIQRLARTLASAGRRTRTLSMVTLIAVVVLAYLHVLPSASPGTAGGTLRRELPAAPEAAAAALSALRRSDLEVLGISSGGSLSAGSTASPLPPGASAALADLARCRTLDCITAAHPRLQNSTKFNFPHFFLAGWQKCATTSIYRHLARHPQIAKPLVKEPHFFTACQRKGPACKVAGGASEAAYIRDALQVDVATAAGLTVATLDASVDYAMFGAELAPVFARQFPWLKLVFVMRERVGRAMSWKNMLDEKFGRGGCKEGAEAACLEHSLQKSNYTAPMEAWLAHFPPSQVLVMQFEALAAAPGPELRRLKNFLGLDPELPEADLANVNGRPGSSGWRMGRREYEALVAESRRDGEALTALLARHGLADGREWMELWETVWKANLATCGKDGMCQISSA